MEDSPKGVTLKTDPNYIDLLDEDKPIAGQKFMCLSFISPEHILKKKELYFFEEFLKHWDLSKSMEKYNQFLNFLCYKYKLDFNKIMDDFKEFCDTEKESLINSNTLDEYKNFMDAKEEQLETQFNKDYEFQTNVRGIKVRGVFPTQEEAELRCKLLRKVDPNHDVYVGPVGLWVPFHPEAYKTGRVEYMEETLNELMSNKKKNEEEAKDEFDKRVKETKENAIKENIENAEKSGNKLTQTIDDQGNLISLTNSDSNVFGIPDGENTQITSDDIQKAIFETDNVVLNKNSDKGLSQLTNNK
jgi:rRNA maturation endonuclease Nob1